MNFFSRTVAERTSSGQRQSIQENSYTAHVFSRASDNLSGVIVTDAEYPVRVAFSLLNKILDEFTTNFTRSVWEQKAEEGKRTGKPCLIDWSKLQEYISKYQDPRQADTIMKVQQELDETKIILVRFLLLFARHARSFPSLSNLALTPIGRNDQHKTIESVLERGEKLDSLVDKSQALSASSKAFYKTAKSQVRFRHYISYSVRAELMSIPTSRIIVV